MFIWFRSLPVAWEKGKHWPRLINNFNKKMNMSLLYYPEIWRKTATNSKIDNLNFNARQNDDQKCHATLVTIWTSIHTHVLVISLTLTCFSLCNIYWLSNNLSTLSTKEIWISKPDPASGFLFSLAFIMKYEPLKQEYKSVDYRRDLVRSDYQV